MKLKPITPFRRAEYILVKILIISSILFSLDCNGGSKTGEELYDSMLNALHRVKSLYYETEVRYSGGVSETICTLRVWLKKPNYVRVEYAKKGELNGVLTGDGDYFWIYWPGGRHRRINETDGEYELTKYNCYFKKLIRRDGHSIWHLIPKLGLPVVAFQPSLFHGCPDALDKLLDSIISHGTEKIDNEICDVIEVSFMNHQRSHFYWLSKKDHLPRRVKDVVRVADSSFCEENWSNLTVNHKIPDTLFLWIPPEGWHELTELKWEERLLPIGAHAPDFAFKTLDGQQFKLAEQKGKVVLINFWRIGCPPCRTELSWLEDIYETYKDSGLVVIGFNVLDDEKLTRELLKSSKITYPNILDTSAVAQRIFFEEYQQKDAGCAVPLNYLIDRKGFVISAWYGGGFYYNRIKEAVRSQ